MENQLILGPEDYEIEIEAGGYQNATQFRGYGSTSSFCRGIFALLLRVGFILIQIGCVPISNVNRIVLHHLIDIACSTAAFGFLGYMFAFGEDRGGFIGVTWIISDDADMDNAVLGWAAIIIATALLSTTVGGRIHGVGLMIIVIVFAGLIEPLILHWAWSEDGWLFRNELGNSTVSYKDMGGSSVVHVSGGSLALFGALFLGRRILRLRDMDESSLPPDAPGAVAAGYLFVIICLMALCLPYPSYEHTHVLGNYIAATVINNIMALAGGILIVVFMYFIKTRIMMNYWFLTRCLQGGVAGMVTVAAGVDIYLPLVAFLLGILGALLFHSIAWLMFDSALEDTVHIIPIHLLCGFLGTLLPPFAGSGSDMGPTHNLPTNFAWQLIGVIVITLVMMITAFLLFLILKCVGLLRNTSEKRDHERALIIEERGPEVSRFERLLKTEPEYHTFLRPGYKTKQPNFYTVDGTGNMYGQQQGTGYPQPGPWDQSVKGTKQQTPNRPPVYDNRGQYRPMDEEVTYSKQKLADSRASRRSPDRQRTPRRSDSATRQRHLRITPMSQPPNKLQTLAVYTVLNDHLQNTDQLTGDSIPSTEAPHMSVTPEFASTTSLHTKGMKMMKLPSKASVSMPNISFMKLCVSKGLTGSHKVKRLSRRDKKHPTFRFLKHIMLPQLNKDMHQNGDLPTDSRKNSHEASPIASQSTTCTLQCNILSKLPKANCCGDSRIAETMMTQSNTTERQHVIMEVNNENNEQHNTEQLIEDDSFIKLKVIIPEVKRKEVMDSAEKICEQSVTHE